MHNFGSFKDYVAGHLSLLRAACTTEAVIGQQPDGTPSCFFLTSGASGNPRTQNGIIPVGPSFGSAVPLQMVDLEAGVECTSPKAIIMGALPRALVNPLNRQIDLAIVGALDGCDRLTAMDASGGVLDLVDRSLVALGKSEVPIEDEENMFAIGGPTLAAMIHKQVPSRADNYVTIKMAGREYKVLRWAGLNWVVVPVIAGAGTSREQCYVLHRHAIGHALDLAALDVTGGIDPKTGTGWMKAKTKHLAAVLQPCGVVRVNLQ